MIPVYIISGFLDSGKTEFIKYLAAHTKEDEKIITIEDTLELHLDKIFPKRDIVAMKTNNIASYSDVLVTCMRQNPRWILLSEVRSAEAVMAVRNSISSGHNILSTIHADKASSIPNRLYSLLETNQDLEQFLRSIHRYVQLGVHIKGYYSKERGRFHREIAEVCEFYVTEDNEPKTNLIYKKTPDGRVTLHNPTKYLLGYLESQGMIMPPDILVKEEFKEQTDSPLDETISTKTVDNVNDLKKQTSFGQINGGYVNGNQGSFTNINSMNSSTIKNVNSSNINPNTISTTNNNVNARAVYPQQQYINQQGVGQYNRNFVQNGNNIPNVGQVQGTNQQIVGQNPQYIQPNGLPVWPNAS